jgi:nicotinate phosphoribosyltransferase
VKLSEQAIKTSTPGILQVRRYGEKSGYVADMIYHIEDPLDATPVMIDPGDPTRRKTFTDKNTGDDLLVPVFRRGACVYPSETLEDARRRMRSQLECFHSGIKRFVNPHQYPVGLEQRLYKLKTDLIMKARNGAAG